MKNKMLARRIAIAMLSAGMVATTVPVSVFAADVQSVSVEASDATYTGQSVTDADFQSALKSALATYTPTGDIGSDDEKETSKDTLDAKFNNLAVSGYTFENFRVTGHTAPSYKTTATGGELVMPVLTVTADVKKSGSAYGTITFTCDAKHLTKSEQVAAAKAVLEGAGGTDVDPAVSAATTYSNTDNSTSLKGFVDNILNKSRSDITNVDKITGVTVKVTQGTVTPATKSAAGSEVVNIELSTKLLATSDKKDPAWDDTAADQKQDQTVKDTASYTATIKKLAVTSDDADYQAKVEQALSAVTFTNQNFVGAIKSGNKGAAFTSTDTTITSNGGITADATVTKALASVGVYEANNAGSNLAITYRNFTAASHKADGSVTILLDQKRDQTDGTTEHAYATVTVPVTHADDTVAIGDEVSAKIVALVKAYVADSKDITPTTLDATAQKKEITAKLQAAVEKALSDKLDGTNTIASEIDKVEVEITDFEASTATGNGKIKKANVIVTFKDDAPAITNPGAGFDAQPVSGKKKQLTFSYDSTSYGSEITLYKVTAVSATSLTLPEETPYNTLTKTNEVKVTPTFTPSDSNNYVIRWSLDDNSKFKFTTDAYATYDKAKTSADDGKISDASAAKIAFLANDGITIDTTSANAGDTATLTAELIDSDGLVAAKATTTLKAVKGFSDVQNTHDYAYNAIKYLSTSRTVNKNDKYTKVAVIEGVGNNLFNSNGDVTRAQFVTFLYRLAQWESDEYTSEEAYSTYTDKDNNTPKTISIDGTDTNVSAAGGEAITYYSDGAGKTYSFPKFTDSKASNKFTDVDANAYYAKAVDWAVANGIANGKTDTTFDPNGKVTRAEAATFLYRYYANGQSYNAADFTDVPTTAYYANAVGWASSNGVTQGKTATTFAPNDTTTRKETAAFIYRATNTAKINK